MEDWLKIIAFGRLIAEAIAEGRLDAKAVATMSDEDLAALDPSAYQAMVSAQEANKARVADSE